MNMTPERLLGMIGKQQVMIELLQEKVKALQAEQQHSEANAPCATAPPPWAKHTKAQETS